MKVKDLKKIIDELAEEDLELDVAVFADHGQSAIEAMGAEPDWITTDGEGGIIGLEDLHEYDAEDVERVFLIDG